MASERQENRATRHALGQVFDYISPGTNEGISFSLSRLTDDVFADSFLGGGDISLFTPHGHRGRIKSQLSHAWMLDPGGGAPTQFAVELTVDLSSANGSGSWILPNGTHQTPTFGLQHVKTHQRPEGLLIVFAGETSTDDAVYSLALLLI